MQNGEKVMAVRFGYHGDWNELKAEMIGQGWVCDLDDETKLNFSKYVDEKTEWFRDYNKETGSSVQWNGRKMINIMVTRHE